MPWLLVSPGHQQPLYLYRINHACLLQGRVSTTCSISLLNNDWKFKWIFMFPKNEFSTARVMHGFNHDVTMHGGIWGTEGQAALIARFMGLTWGPPGADRTQVGPRFAPSGWETKNFWHSPSRASELWKALAQMALSLARACDQGKLTQ